MARKGKLTVKIKNAKQVRRAVRKCECNWLQKAIDRAAKQIDSWPDWKRSIDHSANGRADA